MRGSGTGHRCLSAILKDVKAVSDNPKQGVCCAGPNPGVGTRCCLGDRTLYNQHPFRIWGSDELSICGQARALRSLCGFRCDFGLGVGSLSPSRVSWIGSCCWGVIRSHGRVAPNACTGSNPRNSGLGGRHCWITHRVLDDAACSEKSER